MVRSAWCPSCGSTRSPCILHLWHDGGDWAPPVCIAPMFTSPSPQTFLVRCIQCSRTHARTHSQDSRRHQCPGVRSQDRPQHPARAVTSGWLCVCHAIRLPRCLGLSASLRRRCVGTHSYHQADAGQGVWPPQYPGIPTCGAETGRRGSLDAGQ